MSVGICLDCYQDRETTLNIHGKGARHSKCSLLLGFQTLPDGIIIQTGQMHLPAMESASHHPSHVVASSLGCEEM